MELFFYIAELIGTIAFAFSGALLAIHRGLDLFGIICLSVVTALGGGTVRDVILGQTPPKMFYNGRYVLLAVVVALLLFLAVKLTHGRCARFNHTTEILFELCDALGLGIFAVTGSQAVISMGLSGNGFLCIFMGTTTAVGGGILRDMMSGLIPAVLRKHIYALAAIVGSCVFYFPVVWNLLDPSAATYLAIAVTITLRMLARHYRWNLPKIEELS